MRKMEKEERNMLGKRKEEERVSESEKGRYRQVDRQTERQIDR